MRQWVIGGVSGLTLIRNLHRPLFLGKRGDDYEQEDGPPLPGNSAPGAHPAAAGRTYNEAAHPQTLVTSCRGLSAIVSRLRDESGWLNSAVWRFQPRAAAAVLCRTTISTGISRDEVRSPSINSFSRWTAAVPISTCGTCNVVSGTR
jgi:hypothetical protein